MEIRGINSINGQVNIPGDKSISHRSAIISSLCTGKVTIENYLYSGDCIRTLEVLEKLSIRIEKNGTVITIHGQGINNFKEPYEILEVGNSGTAIRIMSGLLAGTDFMSVLSGDSSINKRPMGRIIEPLSEMGADIQGRANNTMAPLVIYGNPRLKGKAFNLKISSAQVKSSILMAALHAEGNTEISQPDVSRDHTERMLEYFGADIEYDGKLTRIIPGKDLKGKNIYIPGDISSAAFFIVASLICKNSRTIIKGVGINPTRSHFIELLQKMGGKIEIKNRRDANNEPIADIETFSSVLDPIEINKEAVPGIIDEIPILCIAASFARGNTVIKGVEELRYKESDRISAIVSEFNKLGANIEESENDLIIRGNKDLVVPENTVESFGDHRIAMSLAIMSLLSVGKVTILGSDCINTSFPTFKHELQQSTGLDL